MPPSARARTAPHDPAHLPMRLLLDQIADKWSVLILAVLCDGPLRFNELKRRLAGVSQKALASTLRSLERNGIVSREVLIATPIAVEYAITPLGRTLEGPCAALHAWSERYLPDVERARAAYDASQA